ncbi:hypothetical protein J6A31_04860 [bacterium]|nr:hypothetical protein [bacterium]
MVVLNTTFSVDKSLTRQELFNLAVNRANMSAQNAVNLSEYDWANEEQMFESPHYVVEIMNYESLFVMKFINRSDSTVYTTTYMLDDKSDSPSIHISQEFVSNKISAQVHKYTDVTIPELMKDIIWNEFGGEDHGIYVNDEPLVVRKNDCDLAKSMLCNEIEYDNPIVYIPYPKDGHHYVNYKNLADMLMGLAHVVVEGTPVASTAVANVTQSANMFDNVALVCLPGSSDNLRIDISTENPEINVFGRILEILSYAPVDDKFNILRIKQKRALSQLGEDSELSQLCESMLAEKDNQIDALKSEISTLKNQLMTSKAKAENLQNSFDKSDDMDKHLSLKVTESELYEGELKTVVLKILQKEYDSMKDDPNLSSCRKFDVLGDILDQNFPCTTDIDLIECIRGAFKDGVVTREGVGRLQSSGFVVEKNDKQAHYRVTLNGDDRYYATFASTPSDKARGYKNAIADFSNTLFGY